jgi:hypothetical protein
LSHVWQPVWQWIGELPNEPILKHWDQEDGEQAHGANGAGDE